jgi:hypothetical protein
MGFVSIPIALVILVSLVTGLALALILTILFALMEPVMIAQTIVAVVSFLQLARAPMTKPVILETQDAQTLFSMSAVARAPCVVSKKTRIPVTQM